MWPFTRRLKRTPVARRGFHPQIRDTAIGAMSESLLRASVNSAITVLAIDDIARHAFYRHEVYNMLAVLEGPISWITDLPGCLRPYVSSGFQNRLAFAACDHIIAIFARYYMCRLHVLAYQQWYADIPPEIGVSDDDLHEVIMRASADVDRFFPVAWKELEKGGPEDPESIFQLVSAGRILAEGNELNAPEIQEYVMPRDDLVRGIMAVLTGNEHSSNISTFVEMHLERRLGAWWNDFRHDYQDTFRHWYFAGGFLGGPYEPSPVLWPDIDERLKHRDWLIRAGAAW